MAEPLLRTLARLRAEILAPDTLVRAVASGRRQYPPKTLGPFTRT